LEFREDVQVTHALKVGPAGTVLVEIAIPKPTKVYASPATHRTQNPAGGHTEDATSSKSSGREREGIEPEPEL
jgi:hypothetical protein